MKPVRKMSDWHVTAGALVWSCSLSPFIFHLHSRFHRLRNDRYKLHWRIFSLGNSSKQVHIYLEISPNFLPRECQKPQFKNSKSRCNQRIYFYTSPKKSVKIKFFARNPHFKNWKKLQLHVHGLGRCLHRFHRPSPGESPIYIVVDLSPPQVALRIANDRKVLIFTTIIAAGGFGALINGHFPLARVDEGVPFWRWVAVYNGKILVKFHWEF